LNSQQLQEARQALWHHDDKPLTTLDDARKWLDDVGICLWLPRGSQFAAPMPSFVEACAGVANATPSGEAIAHATDLLARLTESGAAVPLNLLGTNLGVEGERADFIVASSALPYVYALRGARPWKAAPPTGGAGRVSTLSLRVWEALQSQETMELSQLREIVGHDVSDAGVLRALGELWSTHRVFPIPQLEGKPARWQLLSRRFAKQLNAGSSMGQAAALSALISLYLDSVVAASTEEIEAALSPLVARSRVGEVVRALEANRQIEFTAVGGALLMHFSGVEAHLPPAVEIVLPPAPAVAASSGPKKYTPRTPRAEPSERTPRPARPTDRTFPARERRPSTGEESPRPSFPRRAASGSTDRGTRKPYGDRSQFKPRAESADRGEKRAPFGGTRTGPPRERAPFKSHSGDQPQRRTFAGPRSGPGSAPRSGPPRERAPFKPRSAGGPPRERTPFKPRPAGAEGEQRRSFASPRSRPGSGPPRERAPFKPRSADGPQRKSFGGPRGGSGSPSRSGPPRERSSFSDSSRRPSSGAPKRFSSARPPREGRPPASSRPRGEGGKPFAPRKPYGAKAGGFSKPAGKFGGKPGGTFGASRPPRAESSEGPKERRPWKDRPTGGPRSARPAGDRPAGKSFGAKKSTFGKSTSKPFSDRPRGPRSEASGAKPGGFGKRPGGGFKKSSGPSSSGPRKPGGFSKGPGGTKRPGSFGKKPGGFGKRPGGGKPR
jgi:23S rRNA pseudouridine2605 synthase